MARPTKLTPELIQKASEYLDNYEDEIPTIAGLALELDVSRETVYDWANNGESQEFSDTVTRIQSTQERTLVNKGLTGDFNASITKLILTKHGYSDKQEQEIKVRGKIISPLGGESVSKNDSNE